jgi:hypothetical protein
VEREPVAADGGGRLQPVWVPRGWARAARIEAAIMDINFDHDRAHRLLRSIVGNASVARSFALIFRYSRKSSARRLSTADQWSKLSGRCS